MRASSRTPYEMVDEDNRARYADSTALRINPDNGSGFDTSSGAVVPCGAFTGGSSDCSAIGRMGYTGSDVVGASSSMPSMIENAISV